MMSLLNMLQACHLEDCRAWPLLDRALPVAGRVAVPAEQHCVNCVQHLHRVLLCLLTHRRSNGSCLLALSLLVDVSELPGPAAAAAGCAVLRL